MYISKLLKLARYFNSKQSAFDLYLYVFVPRASIDSIKKKGLLSAASLIKDKAALKSAKPNNWKSFKKSIEEKLNDPEWKEIVNGISAFFTLPDWDKLPSEHFIYKDDLVPIKINFTKLIKDKPKIKLLGVELSPKLISSRERNLSVNEVKNYSDKTPSMLWEHYQGESDKYAPNVPHVIIIADKILPKYLNI